MFISLMRLLYVHKRLGRLGGAEANVLITATELRHRNFTAFQLLHDDGSVDRLRRRKVSSLAFTVPTVTP